MNRSNFLRSCLALGWFLAQAQVATACPFCSAASQTLSEELAAAEAAIIAKLVKAAPAISPDADDPAGLDANDPDTGMAHFLVEEVLLGGDKLGDLKQIEVVYFGENEENKRFLISGVAGLPIDWTTPLPLSPRAVAYVKHLRPLPEKGPDRLTFFMQYLEDKNPLLAQDAYDEFARAPYDEITAMVERLDRQQLTGWIEDPEVGPTRRRLYLTLLGICGQDEDIAMLESLLRYDYAQMKPGIAAMVSLMGIHGSALGTTLVDELIRADVRRKRQCLDALIAAYLKLKGPEGLPLIEGLFLSNPNAEYTHVYATIMALRFHGEESEEIPLPRLQQSLRLVLDNPEIADQVIPDLARWEDWSILDRLVGMFKESEEGAWVRQPVIAYLLTAEEQPEDLGKRATEALAELEELDPQGVKRARSYMAFGLLARGGKPKPKTDPKSETEKAAESEAPVGKEEANKETVVVAPEAPADTTAKAETTTLDEPPADAAAPNRLMIIGIPLIAGLVLVGVFALLLRGSDARSPHENP
ncbi:MAG: hypothetical protein GXP28_06440 [Planctomycetes bacterium]|nr:hypothetical protein [Planctomycetota bacterium]